MPDAIIMNQTGHRLTEVMDGCKRVATGFTDNAVTMDRDLERIITAPSC